MLRIVEIEAFSVWRHIALPGQPVAQDTVDGIITAKGAGFGMDMIGDKAVEARDQVFVEIRNRAEVGVRLHGEGLGLWEC